VEIWLFFITVFAVIVLSPPLARWLRVPAITIQIIFGIILGRSVLDIIKVAEVPAADFLGQLGLVLLMFLAGFELSGKTMRKEKKPTILMFFTTGIFPCLVGVAVALALGLRAPRDGSWLTPCVLMGALFTSSSVAVIVPVVKELERTATEKVRRIFRQILGSTILMDIFSLLLVTVVISLVVSKGPSDLIVFVSLLTVFLIAVMYVLPRFAGSILGRGKFDEEALNRQVGLLIFVIVFFVAVAEALNIHAIVGAFLVGMGLANVSIKERTIQRIRFLGFGLFVPVFFFRLGLDIDLRVLASGGTLWLPTVIVLGLVFSKMIGGVVSGKLLGYSTVDSLAIGLTKVPQLTATLAAGVVGHQIGVFTDEVLASVVTLSVVTTLIGPVVTRNLLYKQAAQPRPKLVEDYIVTDLETLPQNAPFTSVLAVAQRTPFQLIPVVDRSDRLRGIIRFDDIKEIIFSTELDSMIIAGDMMVTRFVALGPKDDLDAAVEKFKITTHDSLPVVEEVRGERIFLGMLRVQDIMGSVSRRASTPDESGEASADPDQT